LNAMGLVEQRLAGRTAIARKSRPSRAATVVIVRVFASTRRTT
jgi:hypothetical protein